MPLNGFPLAAAVAMAIPVTGGFLSGIGYTEASRRWNESLKKPSWQPPDVAFPIVWTSLYCGMGYASYLVWKNGGGFAGPARLPLIVYGVQLALNFSWFPTYFGQRSIKGGLIVISLLDMAVVGTTGLFYNVKPAAGYIMVPYLAWLTLATALNYRIYKDNPIVECVS